MKYMFRGTADVFLSKKEKKKEKKMQLIKVSDVWRHAAGYFYVVTS